MKVRLRQRGRKVIHLFDGKPYLPDVLKAKCGYVAYWYRLVPDEGRTYNLCKKCVGSTHKRKEERNEPQT